MPPLQGPPEPSVYEKYLMAQFEGDGPDAVTPGGPNYKGMALLAAAGQMLSGEGNLGIGKGISAMVPVMAQASDQQNQRQLERNRSRLDAALGLSLSKDRLAASSAEDYARIRQAQVTAGAAGARDLFKAGESNRREAAKLIQKESARIDKMLDGDGAMMSAYPKTSTNASGEVVTLDTDEKKAWYKNSLKQKAALEINARLGLEEKQLDTTETLRRSGLLQNVGFGTPK